MREEKSIQEWDWNRWRADEAVAGLRAVARCVWFELLGVMWKSGQTGEISRSFADLAKLSRVTETEARAAIEQIKACDVADVTISGNGVVTLVCRYMKRTHENRQKVRERVQKHRQSKGVKVVENERCNAGGNAFVTSVCNADVTQPPSAPFSPSPITLSPISPPTPGDSVATQRRAAAAQRSGDLFGAVGNPVADAEISESTAEKTQGTQAKTRERRLTADQQACRDWFNRWWCDEAWPRHVGNGAVYDFQGGRDALAVLKILRTKWVSWDLEQAKYLAETYLTADNAFIARQGKPLHGIAEQINHWVSQAAARKSGRKVSHGTGNFYGKQSSQGQYISTANVNGLRVLNKPRTDPTGN